ncbi:MAG: hypothetical protein CL782_01090 [Chloroflexi bacterium]|nr:hypothetical protein [Chloroflexota bacterium]|tara:strand:- start:74829 stop:75890 length:1062 start_codon:yes stop_codon:yes gene_type:complete
MIFKKPSKYNLIPALLIISLFIFACSDDEELIVEPAADEPAVDAVVEVVEEVVAPQVEQVVDPIAEVVEEVVEEVVAPQMIEITDALGKPMFFDTVPTSIAAISPSATELLYAAGGKAILRDRASLYPEEVLNLPDIGSSYEPSIEGILEANPDLVIIEALTQARFINSLSAAKLNVMAIKAENLDDIKTNIRNIGTVIGTSDIAEKSIADMETRLNEAKTNDAGSVLFLISDREQNLYAATSKSYTGLVGELAGLTNAADGLEESGPYPGFALMATESILIANPDFIVTITPAPEPAPRLSQSITRIPPFAGLNAIRNNAILEGDKDIFLQSPGPRIVDAVEALANHIAGIR